MTDPAISDKAASTAPAGQEAGAHPPSTPVPPKPAVPPVPPTVTVKLDHGTHVDDVQALLDAASDARHRRFSGRAALIALFCLFGSTANEWLVQHGVVLIPAGGQFFDSVVVVIGAAVVVGSVDVYLLLMLVTIVGKGKTLNSGGLLEVPDRGAALRILPLLLVALVTAFATVHRAVGFDGSDTPWHALVDSFVTAAGLDHTRYLTGTPTEWARGAVLIEVISALLFLLVFFPLLVSRLAMFSSDNAETTPPQPGLTLSGEATVSWSVEDANNKGKTFVGRSIRIGITNKRQITVAVSS